MYIGPENAKLLQCNSILTSFFRIRCNRILQTVKNIINKLKQIIIFYLDWKTKQWLQLWKTRKSYNSNIGRKWKWAYNYQKRNK